MCEKGGKKMLKSDFEKSTTLITEEMLSMRICQIARQITADYDGKALTLICVLKGAMFFFTDLTRRIRLDTNLEFIRVSSYEGETSTGEITFKVKLDEPVTGKDVIVVEDIIDTGNTMSHVLAYLKAQKPNSLKLCALLDKPERRLVHNVKVDYIGFTIPNRFVIGYGLDLDEKYRNLPTVDCIVKSEEEAELIKKDRENLLFMLSKTSS